MATNPNSDSLRPLGWLLYLLAALLVVGPLSEWIIIAFPTFSNIAQWRFASIGLLGDRLTLPMVGLFTAILSATLLEQRAVQSALGVLSLLAVPTLVALAVAIGLDGLQLRNTVRGDVLSGFDQSLFRTVVLLLYAAVVAAVLGLAALKARRTKGSHRSDATPARVLGPFAHGPGA